MALQTIVNSAQDSLVGSIVDVSGLLVGHFTMSERLTSCSVVQAPNGVVGAVDVRGIGFETGHGRAPIVPAAVLFDLPVVRPGDNPTVRPGADAGYAACQAASNAQPAAGNVGAGAGACVGKLFGLERSMKGGFGRLQGGGRRG